MSTIVTRAGKGSALTHAEVDANFTNLNTDKVEKAVTLTANYILKGNGTNSATLSGVIEDGSGNVGVGVTPSAWSGSHRALQLPSIGIMSGLTANGSAYYFNNSYFNGSSFIYSGNGAAARYDQGAGVHSWYTSASGTAGNSISFTQIMTLDASGNLGVNESAPDYKLDVNGTFGFTPGASVTPVDNGDVVFELTNNTTLTIKAKGSDGTVRSATVTLA